MSVPLIVLAVVLLILDILLRRFPEIIDRAAMALIRLKPKKKPKEIFAEKKNANKPTEEEKIIKMTNRSLLMMLNLLPVSLQT